MDHYQSQVMLASVLDAEVKYWDAQVKASVLERKSFAQQVCGVFHEIECHISNLLMSFTQDPEGNMKRRNTDVTNLVRWVEYLRVAARKQDTKDGWSAPFPPVGDLSMFVKGEKIPLGDA
jgi:hypothetical protein